MVNGIINKVESNKLPADDVKHHGSTRSEERKQGVVVTAEDEKKTDNFHVEQALERVTSAAKLFDRKIHLELENDLGIIIVKVIDQETDKVIRQIPPEELVQLSKNAQDLKGLLIDKEG